MDFSLNSLTNWLSFGKSTYPERGSDYLSVYMKQLETDFKAYDPNFKIVKWLGSGGFCDVFLATDVHVPGKGVQNIGLRVLRPSLYRTPRPMVNNRIIKTFFSEIFYNTFLTSQNVRQVVKLLDYGCHLNKHYFTMMEYIEGPNFLEYILEAPKDERELVRRAVFINAVAGVVGELHFRGVIHRDLKPTNIIVKGLEPYLTDFGSARWIHVQDDVGDERLSVLGTPAHMSYEQLEGDYYNIDYRTDIFSMGAMASFAFTGVHPFHEREKINYREEGIAALSRVEPDIPKIPFKKGSKLRNFLLKTLSRNPNNRPGHMSEFQYNLNMWILQS